jgi:hypothetical protein
MPRCAAIRRDLRRFAVTPGGGRAIMAAVEQLTFGNEPAAARAAVGPSRPGYEIERELAAAGARCVAGVDEGGRGAWAGPVRASCPCYDRRDEASDANTTVELR